MSNPIAEIVTFKLAEGVSAEAFVELSKESEAYVRAQPGFMFRRLSCGADGRWSDHVVWADMDTAQRVAAEFPKQPFASRLIAAIDPENMEMRHEEILWQMSA